MAPDPDTPIFNKNTANAGRPRDMIGVFVVNPDGSILDLSGGGGTAVVDKLEEIRLQNVDMIALLTQIRDNTASV